MMNDQIRSKHVEQTKNCGIKTDYKNSASRWSLTHCNVARSDRTAGIAWAEYTGTMTSVEARLYDSHKSA